MADERQSLREWHRLFGLLVTDLFTGSPFEVEIERDLSVQQQFLDVLIVRRRPGRMTVQVPDGLEDLVAHNLISFKSHHEALDAWALKELMGHYVAYRKLVSPNPSDLISEDQFGLYAVCARFPATLSAQVTWQERRQGVYDCVWGTDTVRVVVAGDLPQQGQNAPLHLFSAKRELVAFGSANYEQRSEDTSQLLRQLFQRFRGEGLVMPYTMQDFRREYAKEHFYELTPEEQQEALEQLSPERRHEILQAFPPEERLNGLSAEEIRKYLDQINKARKPSRRKSRKKK
jgi:hypothetical protein